jgi:hypothetical protein
MARNSDSLEVRLSRVEKEVAELRAALSQTNARPWYRQIVGSFAGDKAFAHIVRLGRAIRRGKLKG